MINLTPNLIEIIPARDKIQRPINTDSFDLSQLFGGWKSTQSEFRKGSLNIKANEEQILAGSATARLTGIGIFFGKDTVTGLYEFRCGDPANNYFHYDGTNLTLKGGTLSAGSITSSSLRTQAAGVGNAIDITTATAAFSDADGRTRMTLHSDQEAVIDFRDNLVANNIIGTLSVDNTNKQVHVRLTQANWNFRLNARDSINFDSNFNVGGEIGINALLNLVITDENTVGAHYAEFKTRVKLNPHETTYAPLKMGNYSANPTDASDVGDLCVVSGILMVCTVAGTPGTWTVVGTQT